MINYNELEQKWQKAWAEAKIFEPEVSDKKSALVFFAFPYPNSPLHAGHMKTYSLTDVYARYLRLRGFNVLLPCGFHVTGTPILGIAKRVAQNEKEIMDDFRNLYHIQEEDIKKMGDPQFVANYFTENAERSLRRAGLGVDWRRKFTTTDPRFSKFIEWQFKLLKEKGYLIKGTHPVGWCPNEKNAVGQHDTKGDVQPKIESVLAIKFKDPTSDVYFACTTYRPETIYGVTNIFVKEDGAYVIAEINGEKYYLAKEAAGVLVDQFDIKIIRELGGRDLLQKSAINPITKETVPILPGFFVKTNMGTGIVMSVPSHAPFDYVALERLKAKGHNVPQIEYKKLIELEPRSGGIGASASVEERSMIKGRATHAIPAMAYLELLNANPNSVDDMIEFATKLIYREESRWGVMLVGPYKGRKETEAREGLKKDFIKSNDAFEMFVIANDEPVKCRCGFNVTIKIVKDQWFINYGDPTWKVGVRRAVSAMKIIPERLRPTFDSIIEWIDMRATERAQGLGTKFPFNPEHVIESLSDSTLYPAFYTFSHVLEANNVQPGMLDPVFFDYVITGRGDPASVERITGINSIVTQKCKEQFEYWYQWTSNHSAIDLLPNHYAMYVFNHVAIMQEQHWPKQIVPNGLLMYEGQKMSKSIGNTVPVLDLMERIGADPLRFTSVATGDLGSETNFDTETVNSVKQKNEFLLSAIDKLNAMKGTDLDHIDYWLYSKLNSKIKEATKYMEIAEFRSAYTEIYYNSIAEMKYYIEKGGRNQIAFRDFLSAVTVMTAPIMPHFAEEMWRFLGGGSLVAQEKWPTADDSMINAKVEKTESIILNAAEDLNNAISLTSKIDANRGKHIKEIRLIIADDWKRFALNHLIQKKEIAKVLKEKELESVDKERASKFLAQFMGKLNTLQLLPDITDDEIYAGFAGSREYLRRRFGVDTIIEKESVSKSPRAARAMPDKPSIDLYWG